jgi:purine/pyrimidine-nucleoside phosphorylase
VGFPAPCAGPLSPSFDTHRTMTTTQINNVSLTTKANVYFDGKCVSHGFTLADGSKQSVGVILPATLTFNTGAPEIMECVGGSCDYQLDGSDVWVTSGEGQKFSVPGNAKFQIRVTEGFDAYHYICYFG